MRRALKHGSKMPAWAAVLAVCERFGLSPWDVENASQHWWGRMVAYVEETDRARNRKQ